MNNQDGRVLTPSVAQELIQELFAGRTARRQQIVETVDEVHRERGGQPPSAKVHHPAEHALSKMKQLNLADNPERGLWFISEKQAQSDGQSSSEEQHKIKTLEDFLRWAQNFGRGEYVFRGVPNEKYRIEASAFRRPKEDRDFEKFLQVNKDLVRDACLRGYDQKEGRELKELEILADLQHFGAATCLIDFTYNAQVALYFACEDDSKQAQDCSETRNRKNLKNLKRVPNGKVFAVRKKPPSRFKEIVPDMLKKDIGSFLKDEKESQLYCWQPRQQNNRIIAQQSIFLFGRYTFYEDDMCVIEGSSKEGIMNALQQVSGITEDSLFPDFEGFAHVRREEVPYTELTASQYTERGFQAYERNDNEDAIADYNLAIELQPNDAITYYLRGVANHDMERYDNALTDYDEAINLQSDYADAYRDRGLLNYQEKRYDDALADFDEAINLDPHDAEAYSGRGLTKYQLEWYEEALEDFDEAIRLDSKSGDDYHYRGIIKFQMRRIQDALADFDEAIRLNPNDGMFYYNRGITKNNYSQYESAISDFDRVISLHSKNAEAYYNRARSKFRLNRLEEAKKDLVIGLPLAVNNRNEELIDDIGSMLREIDFRISRGSQDE